MEEDTLYGHSLTRDISFWETNMRIKINNRDAYVTGEWVDENNHLWYFVEENGETKKEDKCTKKKRFALIIIIIIIIIS